MHFIRCTVFFVLCLCSLQGYAQPRTTIDSLVSIIAAEHAELYTGLAIGIVQHNQVIYHQGFGFADKKAAMPCTDTTIMEVASVSKAIVGLAIAKAIEMGYCNLD